MCQLRFTDGGSEVLAESSHQRAQRFRRQLLGADFHQEIIDAVHDEDLRAATDSTIGKPSASRLS